MPNTHTTPLDLDAPLPVTSALAARRVAPEAVRVFEPSHGAVRQPGRVYDRVNGAHRGFGNACPSCKVCGYVTLERLVQNIVRGLREQNMKVVAVPGKPEGTPLAMMAPLVNMLRAKGIVVR